MNLANNDPKTMLPVTDMGRAQRFYEDTLGLEKVDAEGEEVVAYRSGKSTITLYQSEFAGTNKATALTWEVGDIHQAIRDLKANGVSFEHYQMPGLRQEGDLHATEEGDFRVAWFKDPDGNILSVASR